jgi:SPX domain protein involved in polyphosphate accumulation
MKFGKEIQEKLTSEWRSEYVDYRKLKNIITRFEEGKEGRADIKLKMVKSMMSAEIISREKERVSLEFFEAQEIQLQKVNLFFNEKVRN